MGTSMGSPDSPLFADMVMDDLENDCFIKLKNEYNCIPHVYYRYVDDTLFIVKKEHVEIALRVFSSYNEHLQFTHKIEENSRINFLDVTLIKDNNSLITDRYQKPTSSGRVLDYRSNHTTQQKKNIIFNLIDRAISLSHTKFHNKNLKTIQEILLNNNYKRYFINSCINNRLRKLKLQKNNNKNSNQQYIGSVSLPYQKEFYKRGNGLFT